MEKFTMYLIITLTTTVGSYLPTLFGVDLFSGWSILGSAIGGFIGVYIIYKLR